MKINVLEVRSTHYETLGYFFDLKRRLGDSVEINFFVSEPNNTWLNFFKKYLSNDVGINKLDDLKSNDDWKSLESDITFVNSIDYSWDRKDVKDIDLWLYRVTSSKKINRKILQLHMASNENSSKYLMKKKQSTLNNIELVSPFKIYHTDQFIMPYTLPNERYRNLNGSKIRLCLVGGIHKVKKETLNYLKCFYDVTFFSPHDGKRCDNVKYFINTSTEDLINYLSTNVDYIFIDYPFRDRLSGIIPHAISLGIPFIINKEYSDQLEIPNNCFISYEDPTELELNLSSANYTKLVSNLNHYKNVLQRNMDLFLGVRGKKILKTKNDSFELVPNERSLLKKYFRGLWKSQLPKDQKLKLSNGLFAGKDAYIFAAGPSLSRVDIERLYSRLERSFVISIKQSIDIVGEVTDCMIMNFCNFSEYRWNEIVAPVLWTIWQDKQETLIRDKGAICDVAFRVVDNDKATLENFKKTTAGKCNWNNLLRFPDSVIPWGPGLMYEVAIPLAILSGVKHIYLVGWDIGSKQSDISFHNKHFYDNSKVEMKTLMTNDEIDVVSASTEHLKKWLNTRGIELSIISDSSLVHSSVPRKNEWLYKN